MTRPLSDSLHREVVEDAVDFLGDVHQGEWHGPGDRRDKIVARLQSILSAGGEPQPVDVEAMLVACVPGGSICDPQLVADAIRTYFAAAPQGQAQAAPAADRKPCLTCAANHYCPTHNPASPSVDTGEVQAAPAADRQTTHPMLDGYAGSVLTSAAHSHRLSIDYESREQADRAHEWLASGQVRALTDSQIDELWLYRKSIHGGDLTLQLRDFARAILAASTAPKGDQAGQKESGG